MAVQQDEYESVTSPSVISSLLNTMIESGGVTLCLATPDARPEPVVLMEQHAGETLVMDLSSVDYLLSRLQQGEQFFLRGQSQGKVVRTPLLSLTETRRSGGRFLCSSCGLPLPPPSGPPKTQSEYTGHQNITLYGGVSMIFINSSRGDRARNGWICDKC